MVALDPDPQSSQRRRGSAFKVECDTLKELGMTGKAAKKLVHSLHRSTHLEKVDGNADGAVAAPE